MSRCPPPPATTGATRRPRPAPSSSRPTTARSPSATYASGRWVARIGRPTPYRLQAGRASVSSSREVSHPSDEPGDLVLGGVAGAADPHEALGRSAEAGDGGRGVEVAVRDEEGP